MRLELKGVKGDLKSKEEEVKELEEELERIRKEFREKEKSTKRENRENVDLKDKIANLEVSLFTKCVGTSRHMRANLYPWTVCVCRKKSTLSDVTTLLWSKRPRSTAARLELLLPLNLRRRRSLLPQNPSRRR